MWRRIINKAPNYPVRIIPEASLNGTASVNLTIIILSSSSSRHVIVIITCIISSIIIIMEAVAERRGLEIYRDRGGGGIKAMTLNGSYVCPP